MTTNVTVEATYTLVVPSTDMWCTITNPTGVNLEFATGTDLVPPDEDVVGHVLPTYNGVTRHHFVSGAVYARLSNASDPDNTTIVVVDSGS